MSLLGLTGAPGMGTFMLMAVAWSIPAHAFDVDICASLNTASMKEGKITQTAIPSPGPTLTVALKNFAPFRATASATIFATPMVTHMPSPKAVTVGAQTTHLTSLPKSAQAGVTRAVQATRSRNVAVPTYLVMLSSMEYLPAPKEEVLHLAPYHPAP